MTTVGTRIGMVLGTEDVTPTVFWFAVSAGASVQLDDLVVVQTRKPDGKTVSFYGLVDNVRKRHEGVTFESDVEDVVAGVLPASVSYAARVLVTRVDPENFIPPQPGDEVRHAVQNDLKMALSADKMGAAAFPGGLLADGQVLPLNYKFINGERGAHINISGISGVATKTSYALFLLHSIFTSGVMGVSAASGRALIFNVKGEDLLFLDQHNRELLHMEADAQAQRGLRGNRYEVMGLPARPFQNVQFLAPPRSSEAGGVIVPNVEQRENGVTPFLFTLREFCQRRMLPYAFADRDASLNLGFVIGSMEEKLYRLAQGGDTPYLTVPDWQPEAEQTVDEDVQFNEMGQARLQSFTQLVSYLEYKLLEENDGDGDKRWVGKQAPATLQAFIRRLRGVQKHLNPLIRGDITPEQAQRYRPNPLRSGIQMTVVDIHSLSAHAQMFVVGVLLREVFEYKERIGRQDTMFVVLDELNKYAPRDGDSPIKDVLLDIAERGRSLGIILIGAQQTASEVERRIVSNAAIRVVGRLDLAEAERPEYRFLPQSFRARAGILQPGTMLVSQPDVPNPVLINYPFPAWATRKDEVDDLNGRTAAEVGADLLR